MFINPHINNYDDNGTYLFPGTGESHIDVGNQSILNELGTGSFTLSIAYKPTTLTKLSALFSAWDASTTNRVLILRVDTSGNIEIITSPDGANASRWEAAGGMSAGTWHHIVAVFDFSEAAINDRVKIYVDGSDIGATENLDNSDATGIHTGDFTTDGVLLTIGGQDGSTTSTADGTVQIPSIMNRPLTASEVSDLYNSGTPLNSIVRFGDDCILQPTISTAYVVATNELEVIDNAAEQRHNFSGELESRLDRNGGLYNQ